MKYASRFIEGADHDTVVAIHPSDIIGFSVLDLYLKLIAFARRECQGVSEKRSVEIRTKS